MRLIARWMLMAALFAASYSGKAAMGQAGPTAGRAARLSAFGAMTGVYTDVLGGHNLSFTVGADMSFRRFLGVNPSAEFRGMIPFDSGTIAGEKFLMGGLKFERGFGAFHPYGDVLIGRGKIEWQNGGYHPGDVLYISSTSTVYSLGGGVDMDVTPNWAAKLDYQYQFWTTFPPYPGVPNPMLVTGGVVYRFDFGRR
jgi:opacity protein-like surface antigen